MCLTELKEHKFYGKIMELNYKYELGLQKEDVDKIMEAGYFHLVGHGSYAIKKPLSPEWERYITRALNRDLQTLLDAYKAGTLTPYSDESLEIAEEGVKLGPFDFSNERVNVNRAIKFSASMAPWRIDPRGQVYGEGNRWWPHDFIGIFDLVKREQAKLKRKKEKEAARKGKEGSAKRAWSCDPNEDLEGGSASKKRKH